MARYDWKSIESQVSKIAYDLDEPFDASYAILYDPDNGKVEIEKNPSSSSWEKTGWDHIGTIEGLGIDGMKISVWDPSTGETKFEEEGMFDLPEPEVEKTTEDTRIESEEELRCHEKGGEYVRGYYKNDGTYVRGYCRHTTGYMRKKRRR